MNRWAVVAGVLVVAGFCAVGLMQIAKSGVPRYTLLSQLRGSEGREVRFTGSIVRDSVGYDSERSVLRFRMRDARSFVFDVIYEGVKPAGFDGAPEVSVVGVYRNDVFTAKQLTAKTDYGPHGK